MKYKIKLQSNEKYSLLALTSTLSALFFGTFLAGAGLLEFS